MGFRCIEIDDVISLPIENDVKILAKQFCLLALRSNRSRTDMKCAVVSKVVHRIGRCEQEIIDMNKKSVGVRAEPCGNAVLILLEFENCPSTYRVQPERKPTQVQRFVRRIFFSAEQRATFG